MEDLERLKERIKQKGIIMSRVPENTKKQFIELADREFSGDYGLCLKWCLEQALEFQQVKSIFYSNFNSVLLNIEMLAERVNRIEIALQGKEKKIKTLSGKVIEKEVENEQTK